MPEAWHQTSSIGSHSGLIEQFACNQISLIAFTAKADRSPTGTDHDVDVSVYHVLSIGCATRKGDVGMKVAGDSASDGVHQSGCRSPWQGEISDVELQIVI